MTVSDKLKPVYDIGSMYPVMRRNAAYYKFVDEAYCKQEYTHEKGHGDMKALRKCLKNTMNNSDESTVCFNQWQVDYWRNPDGEPILTQGKQVL